MTLNTNAVTSWQAKWFGPSLQETLKVMLVCEKICDVDRSDSKYIWNPYGSAVTTTVQAIAGTYSVGTYTSTDDTLTVADEFVASEHIYDYERISQRGDIFQERMMKEIIPSVATKIDEFVLNNLCEDGTGAYTTPVGGFTTGANIQQIMGDLIGKVMGFKNAYNNLYLVIENTDVTGFLQSGFASGWTFADMHLKNGWVGNYAGVDIYVVRTGTFKSTTLGTTTFTNSGHRLFGVKGVSTYCQPRDIRYEEKGVSAKTGKEVVAYGYIGFKQWNATAGLTVDVTLA